MTETIDIILAKPIDDKIELILTVNGKMKSYFISRAAAAHGGTSIIEALARL